MTGKDPDSNLGVGGRAMFWEGVFEVSSAPKSPATQSEEVRGEAHPGEAVLSSYAHREVRPARDRRSSRRQPSDADKKSGREQPDSNHNFAA